MTHERKSRKAAGGRPVSIYTQTRNGEEVSNEQVKEWILRAIEGDGYAYGYLKLTHWLRREHRLVINKKKVNRLCKELGVLKPQRKVKPKHPRKLARNRSITRPNQLWEVDIKYGYVHGEDRFFFTLTYIDVYDRSVADFYCGLQCEGVDAAETLKRALWRRDLAKGQPMPVIRSDNGPQFVSWRFESTCDELNVEHERIPPRTPNMNAHIESFHKLLEDDCLSRYEFETFEEAYRAVMEFMDYYNNRRLHSSIGHLPPTEFNRKHHKYGLRPKTDVRV